MTERATTHTRTHSMTHKATWNGVVIAESDDAIAFDSNIYFPRSALRKEYLRPSDTKTVCPWKGEASYYHVVVDGKTNEDAAWYYPQTKQEAREIENYVAFWKGVEVS